LGYLVKRLDIASRDVTSSLNPGPILVDRNALLMYCPLDPLGFALTIASTAAARFSRSLSLSKLILPIGK
jgi:hypothetical protein